jgi:glycosyltransferase involved in cell wall biosynthesis
VGQGAAQAIAWLHEQAPFDLIHGQYGSTGGCLAAYQARCLGVAGYVSLRGNDLDRDVYDPARFPQLLWALQHAGAVGGVTRALVAQARALSGRDDVRYTPNSVDGALFHPRPSNPALRERLGLDEGAVIGFAGELRHKKGAAFLLEGFRRVVAALGAQLVIVGTVRTEERRLLDQFIQDEPEAADRLHLVPYVQEPAELVDYYALMDLVVCASLWEGMPNCVLEAMACARPVLGSDAGGLPELITPGETGWLLSRHRLHHLGEALREVLSLPLEERAATGARAREFVLQTFPPERERHELAEAYRAAMSHAK